VSQRLLRATPAAETRTELEVKETLADALGIELLERLFGDAAEARRLELVAERRTIERPFARAPLAFPRDRQDRQMEGREGAQAAEWLEGIDDLARGSFDLLTLSLYHPG
jgi:hypothetical protein